MRFRKGYGHVCKRMPEAITESYCLRCGRPLIDCDGEYCSFCRKSNFAFDAGRALYLHTPDVANAIYLLKFHNQRILAQDFARSLAHTFADTIKRWQIDEVVAVPLHASKKHQRGYNQAEVLAKYLVAHMGLPRNPKRLFRIRKTTPQKLLDAGHRRENLRAAFAVDPHQLQGKNVLLIDDIYTTGQTLHRCAAVLKKAGAKRVYFLTLSIGQSL